LFLNRYFRSLEKLNVVGYINSFRSQEFDRSLEIKIQREKIEDFCTKHNFNLVKIYIEPPESRPDYRPELVKLINNASRNEFEKVIVLKLDKFGNDTSVKTWVASELKKYKIEIYSLTESKLVEKDNSANNSKTKAEVLKRRVKDIPSLPEVVTKVMELVQDPKSSAAQLSRVISHDPGLTSRVLRLVNSAYYGFPKQISSIQHAIMILGFTTMRGLVLSTSIFKIFAPKSGKAASLNYKQFWKHSLVTAIAAKTINKYLFFPEEDDLFSAAILHDIGKIILDQYDHDNYLNVLLEVPDQNDFNKVLEAENKFCEIVHPEIGYIVAEGWNLPESLSNVIKYHHNPLESENNPKMAGIVYLGNIFAKNLVDCERFDPSLFSQNVLEYFGLGEDDLLDINSRIIEDIQDIEDFEMFFK